MMAFWPILLTIPQEALDIFYSENSARLFCKFFFPLQMGKGKNY